LDEDEDIVGETIFEAE